LTQELYYTVIRLSLYFTHTVDGMNANTLTPKCWHHMGCQPGKSHYYIYNRTENQNKQ